MRKKGAVPASTRKWVCPCGVESQMVGGVPVGVGGCCTLHKVDGAPRAIMDRLPAPSTAASRAAPGCMERQ
jgi:hypothetical protein